MLEYKKLDLFAKITKQGPSYSAHIIGREKTDSSEQTELLTTSVALNRMLLEQLLESFGFHQTEIFDALNIEDGQSANIKHPLW